MRKIVGFLLVSAVLSLVGCGSSVSISQASSRQVQRFSEDGFWGDWAYHRITYEVPIARTAGESFSGKQLESVRPSVRLRFTASDKVPLRIAGLRFYTYGRSADEIGHIRLYNDGVELSTSTFGKGSDDDSGSLTHVNISNPGKLVLKVPRGGSETIDVYPDLAKTFGAGDVRLLLAGVEQEVADGEMEAEMLYPGKLPPMMGLARH